MKSMDAEELKKTLDVNERMVREKIQQIRTKKGLSMAEFGKLLGCERQTVFKYEKGLIKTIPLEVIIKIAQIGNTPPLDLLIPAFRARTPKAHYKVLYRVSYMRECGYEWSYEHMKHDYQTYYLHNLYCAFSLMDIIANRTVQCMRLFEENVPLEEITRFSEPQVAHMD